MNTEIQEIYTCTCNNMVKNWKIDVHVALCNLREKMDVKWKIKNMNSYIKIKPEINGMPFTSL